MTKVGVTDLDTGWPPILVTPNLASSNKINIEYCVCWHSSYCFKWIRCSTGGFVVAVCITYGCGSIRCNCFQTWNKNSNLKQWDHNVTHLKLETSLPRTLNTILSFSLSSQPSVILTFK